MMRFRPQPEPAEWNDACRRHGRAWLDTHPEYDRPHPYWTEFEPHLRAAFDGMCAYCAMRIMKGEMDHFLPIAHLKKEKLDALAYEWSNFRYADGSLNGRKGDRPVLDPFLVEDDWFEILLPSLQLRRTERVPETHREIADRTLTMLGLRDGEVILRYRREWYEMYCTGKLSLDGLRRCAPLIARAVEDRAAQTS